MLSNNNLLREIAEEELVNGRTVWSKTINGYMEKLQLRKEDLITMENLKLKEIIRKYDELKWREDISEKSTLYIYRRFLTRIVEVKGFDNSTDSNIMMRARLNVLRVMARCYGSDGDGLCLLCGVEETSEHFLLWCGAYDKIRSKCILLQQPYEMDTSRIIGRVLLLDGEAGVEDLACLSVVGEMCRCRCEVVEQRQWL